MPGERPVRKLKSPATRKEDTMIQHPAITMALAEQRRSELILAAEQSRLARAARPATPEHSESVSRRRRLAIRRPRLGLAGLILARAR
jgi:hypothetical protein